MTKNSKTTATIRRRKGKELAVVLQKLREENASPASSFFSSEEEETAAERADDCYLFHDMVLSSTILRRLISRDHSLFLALIAIRCANALMIQTQYVPDEYWQSLEISHGMVFGYGYQTWEWREGIRGYSYPLVFAFLYKILHIVGLDSRLALIKLPRLVQAIFCAYGDLRLYKLSCQLSGRSVAQWTILCQILSWFTIYCCTRTLSNSAETVLITAALSYFPWPGCKRKRRDLYQFLIFAALSVIVRPTSAIVWILVCSWHIQNVYETKRLIPVLKAYVIVGLVSLGCSAVIDRIWYEKWTFVQLNFALFNLWNGQASMYGTHPWHWYLTQGLPVVMGTHLLPFVVGAWKAQNKVLLWIIVWVVGTHSFLPHKEFRFILPALPMAMCYCGEFFHQLCKPPCKENDSQEKGDEEISSSREDEGDSKNDLSSEKEAATNLLEGEEKQEPCQDKSGNNSATGPMPLNKTHKENLFKAKVFIIILTISNFIPAMYFCLIHQRGTVMVTKYISDAATKNSETSVLYLMPCHSTPYYSYLHQNISMRFLTCQPNLVGEKNFTDEADKFYSDPQTWLLKEYTNAERDLPTIVVMFNSLHKHISPWLTQSGYRLCEKFFHTHLPEGRVGSSVLVACR